MRGHDHDFDGPSSLRPAPSRVDERDGEQAHAVPALLDGRSDVLGAGAVTHLQRTAGNAAVAQRLAGEHEEERSPVHDVVGRGGGRPLDPGTRADMEARLGHDFSDVRVHDDARAHESAVAVNAHAYTVGSDVVFQRDRYDPGSQAGRLTLAHELTHVVQQRSGPVDGTPSAGGVRVSDPGDRFEREAAANAERVLSSPAPVQALHAGHDHAGGPDGPVQRDVVQREGGEDEEEPVQTLRADDPAVQRDVVQREDAEEEDEPVQTLRADGPAVQRESADEEEPE
jgi:hypothetical protein